MSSTKAKPKIDKETQEQQEISSNPSVVALTQALSQQGVQLGSAQALAQGSYKALRKISENNAVFQLKDWERLLNKDGFEGWLTHPQWGSFRSLVARHIGLVALHPNHENQPWGLHSPKDLMEKEAEMIALAKRTTNQHVIPPLLIAQAFEEMPQISEEQRKAATDSCSGERFVVVTEGTAGAGKSFTLKAIRKVYERCPPRPNHPEDGEGYDILGAALSWTAAKVLEGSAELPPGSAKAIEGLVREMDKCKEKNEDFFKRRTILIVDEAGLVGVSHMHKLLKHAAESKHPVRVLLPGYSLQLNPVMAGNALEAIVDECGSARLDTIRRQKQESHRNAVKHFCFGRSEHALWTFWQQEAIHFCPDSEYRRELVMRDYVRYMLANPQKNALVLALENKEVKLLNQQIRERLKQVGRLVGKEYSMSVVDGPGKTPFLAPFCVGDQVVLRKNNPKHPVLKSKFKKIFEGAQSAHEKGVSQAQQKEQGVFSKFLNSWKQTQQTNTEPDVQERQGIFNRMNAIILDIQPHPEVKNEYKLRLLLGEGGETIIDTSEYKDEESGAIPLTHNFATTIYASQGQTVERVFMMDSSMMNRRLAYVGMSRHTELCDLYLDLHELHERMALEQERKKKQSVPFASTLLRKRYIQEPEQLQALHQQVEQWAKEQYFKPSDYLRAVVLVWNKDNLNPTAWMTKKHMQQKKEQEAKRGFLAFKPQKFHADNPEDYPTPRFSEPPAFDSLRTLSQRAQQQREVEEKKKSTFSFFWKKDTQQHISGTPVTEQEQEQIMQQGLESTYLPKWTQTPDLAPFIETQKGVLWDVNRYNYPRLFSKDPETQHIISRWRFDGQLMAGDGEPPVFVNQLDPQHAGWLVVPGSREAFLSLKHYQEKYAQEPQKVPHIVCAFPTSDFKFLQRYVIPGSVTLYCAWSPKDPATQEKALQIAKRLHALGHKVALFPKVAPQTTSQPKP